MCNRLDELISSANGIEFKETMPEDFEKLKKLYNGKIPDTLSDYLKKHMPADDVRLHAGKAFVYYGIERIIEENTDAVPGCNLHPMGLYTFASLQNGDSICFDSNDPAFPVYRCSHSLLEDGDEILTDNGETKIPFEYENILKVSQCLGSSFDEFVMNMIKWKKEDDLNNLINGAASEKQYAKVVEAYEANPDVEIKHLLENDIIAAYNNLDKYDEALEVLERFKYRFENRKRIWYYFAGYAYVGKEDCEKAEECIKAGIEECDREKKANILKGTQYKNEVGDFIYFQWQCQRIRALRFMKDRISSDSRLPEIIQVFREMSQREFEYEDGPGLLFEAYAVKGDSFKIHLVRQTELLRYEEYYQLTVDLEYIVSQEEAQQNNIREVFCNQIHDGDIFEYIESSQAYALLKYLKPTKISIEEVDIEDCVSEKDIKLSTNGTFKENLTINRKPVSNEEQIMCCMKDWDKVKNDKELLKQVEKLVDKAADYYYDDFPDEICEQLNELTGNNWESKAYVDYCFEYWETPWNLKQVVFALFHDGVMPEINEFGLNIVKTSETIDMPGLEIRHALCTGKYGEEFRNKFEDLPQKEIADWFRNTFSGWSMECKEKPDKVTADRIEYGETTYIFTCNDDLEYPLDKFLGVSISNDRTAFVWGRDLSDDEKTSIKSFFDSIGCKFID